MRDIYIYMLGFGWLFFVQTGCEQTGEVQLTVSDDSTLYHTPFKMKVSGLERKEQVELILTAIDAEDNYWESSAVFTANENGVIDPLYTPSEEGSYTGLHPMGLFWSMKSKDDHQIATGKGYSAELFVLGRGDTLASTSFYRTSTRELGTLGITHEPVRDGIIADYYQPSTSDKKPAIIFLGGSGGNFRQERATLFAAEGYAVLNLKYFRHEGLPDGIIEIPLEYVHKAYQWLLARPEIDTSRIGIMGRSMGSELALLYAAYYGGLSYVVAEAPSSVVWFGWEDGTSSFSYRGVGLPYAEYSSEDSERIEKEFEESGVQYHDGPKFTSAFNDEEMISKAEIPVENISCPVLFISGEDDMVWPSTMMANRMMDRLRENDFSYPYAHISYKDAGHNFAGGGQGCGIPNLPAEDYSNSSARGGTDEGNAVAAAESWAAILEFIELEDY